MFRNFLIANIDADDAYYFSKYKKEIFSIFSEELKVGNKKNIIFQKSIFWGFNSIAKTVLARAGPNFKSEKNNIFWKCIFLKYQKKIDEALACFEGSDIGLSKIFYQLTLYVKTKSSVKFSEIEKVVSKIRNSNYPARLKLVNEAIVVIITGDQKHLDKSVLQYYISSSERSEWYDYILLTLTSNSNLLGEDQKKLVLSNLEKTQAGLYFVDLINDSVKTKRLSFFQEYSYQSLLFRLHK